MDEREERQQDEKSEESVEIPVETEEDGAETLGEESSSEDSEEGLGEESSSDVVDEQDGEPGEQSPREDETDASEEELEDLYVAPDESDVEVVDPPEQEGAGDQQESEPAGDEIAADGPSRQELVARIDELEEQVDQLEEERDEYEERMLRAAADLENFRKRAKREKKELKKYGAKPLLEDLIQNIDNLERALEHADSSNEENIIEGVEMVLRQLHSNLQKHGIEQFDSEGEEFDPEQHEAIQQVQTSEQETGTVVDEFQKGYFLHDRLLRPAMVSVADNVVEEEKEGGGEADDEVDQDQEQQSAGDASE